MRIAYLAHINDGRGSGVVAKLAAQVDRWRREGHTVRLFVATADVDDSWHGVLGDATVSRYGGPVSRLRIMTALVRGIRAFRADLLYLRQDLFYPPMLWFPAHVPVVIEVNTDDLAEAALGSRIRQRYHAWTRRFLLRRAAAFVFVTAELSRLPSFARTTARREVISNGIDLAAYPVLPPVADGPPSIVFVGTSGQSWHGIDKLETLAGLRPEWRVDVVGIEDPGDSVKNIRWHGPLERAAVLTVLASADVGIGTLALHRKSMDEASPLKVREYLAVGLPVLYGYRDPDADDLQPFVLKIANTPTNVVDELDRIDGFVHGARGSRVPRARVAQIDTSVKEGQRLALFRDLAGG